VYTRQDTLAVGALSVNITGCPRDATALGARAGGPDPDPDPNQAVSPIAAALRSAIASLVPRCHALPLGVEQARPGTCKA